MTIYDEQGNYLIGGRIELATRAGRPISNDRRLSGNPTRLKVAEELVLKHHNTAVTRSLTGSYNCMGMVFATRRTWVDTNQLSIILEDDDYRKLTSMEDVIEGDVIIYKGEEGQVTHVGLVSSVVPNLIEGSKTINVMSQWGHDGEYFHRIDDVNPLLGVPAEAWTDRKRLETGY